MLELKPKQQKIIQAINNPDIDVIVLIGSVETGKTYAAAHAMVSIADTFPNSYIPIVRLNGSTAKKTVYRTYKKVLIDSNFVEERDYKCTDNVGKITFSNGSILELTEADHTKDPDHMKIKGLEPDALHIDEADELVESAYDMLQSRVGRDPKSSVPPVTIVTMNPNNKWCKTKFYDAWKKGELPSNIEVIEFTRYDSWSDQDRYEKLISSRPRPWVERYVNNNWDFADDDLSLFKYRYFDSASVTKLDPVAPRYAGYDVARSGRDRSVVALWYGKTLVDIVVIKDKDEQITTDDQALELIRFSHENSVPVNRIAVDGVGVGVGVIDHMKSKGMSVMTFVSGAKPTVDGYDNLRSQVIYEFSQGLEKGEIKIYEGCPYRNELLSEAMAHNHKIGDKKLSVESKDDVKSRTGGLSPDIFDAVVMGLYPQLQIDPSRNLNRIGF